MFHAELIRLKYGLFNLGNFSLFSSGDIGVYFFFVLSGFLITYLLLVEHANTSTINIKHFYLRRILRIWPLYYLILIIGLLLMPVALRILKIEYTFHYPLGSATLLFVLFLPNLVTPSWGSSFLTPLWSIGVEEQFYFFWAPLMKYFRKYALVIFGGIVLLRLLFYAYWHFYFNVHVDQTAHPIWSIAVTVISDLKIELMSIGGFGAWLLYSYREKLLNLKIFNVGFQVFLLGVIFIRLCFHKFLIANTSWIGTIYNCLFNSFFNTVVIGVLFLWLIINISSNPKKIISADNKVLNFLGDISYGIYMFHGMVLFVTVIFLKNLLRSLSPVLASVVFYSVATGITVLVAYLSFRFFESKFLLLKHRFEPKGEKKKMNTETVH